MSSSAPNSRPNGLKAVAFTKSRHDRKVGTMPKVMQTAGNARLGAQLVPPPSDISSVPHRIGGNRLSPREQVVLGFWLPEFLYEPRPVSSQDRSEITVDRNHPACPVCTLGATHSQELAHQIDSPPFEG